MGWREEQHRHGEDASEDIRRAPAVHALLLEGFMKLGDVVLERFNLALHRLQRQLGLRHGCSLRTRVRYERVGDGAWACAEVGLSCSWEQAPFRPGLAHSVRARLLHLEGSSALFRVDVRDLDLDLVPRGGGQLRPQ